MRLVDELANCFAEHGAAVTQGDAAAGVNDCDCAGISRSEVEGHFCQASWCGAEPWLPLVCGAPGFGRRLDMTISAPPVLAGTTSNSSMKARMRKMPRPEVL